MNNEYQTSLTKYQQTYTIIRSTLKDHIELQEDQYDIITCWAIGTYYAQMFDSYPILFLNAPKRSGKTKLIQILNLICFNSVMCQDPTSSTFFRLAHTNKCTILIDELESINQKEKGSLRQLIMGRYKKGVTIPRAEQKTQKQKFDVTLFDLYGATAIANITGLDDVLEDRCITLIMKRGLNKQIMNRRVNDNDSIWGEIRDRLYELMLMGTELNERYRHVLPVGGSAVSSAVSDGAELVFWLFSYMKNGFGDGFSAVSALNAGEKRYIYFLKTVNDIKSILTAQTSLITHTAPEGGSYNDKNNNKKNTAQTVYTSLTARNYELYSPLLTLSASSYRETVISAVLKGGMETAQEKEMSDLVENVHVILLKELITIIHEDGWVSVREIANTFKESDYEWFNTRKIGRALKSLGYKVKRHVGKGMQYLITIESLQTLAARYGIEYQTTQPDTKTETVSEQTHLKTQKLSTKSEIIQYIKENDKGQGIAIEVIIGQSENETKTIENLNALLITGDLFEPKPGTWKTLQ